MTRLPRLVLPGFPHHETQRGNRRQDVFFQGINPEEIAGSGLASPHPLRGCRLGRCPDQTDWNLKGALSRHFPLQYGESEN